MEVVRVCASSFAGMCFTDLLPKAARLMSATFDFCAGAVPFPFVAAIVCVDMFLSKYEETEININIELYASHKESFSHLFSKTSLAASTHDRFGQGTRCVIISPLLSQ